MIETVTDLGQLTLALANLPRAHSSTETGHLSWIGPPSFESCMVLRADEKIWVQRLALEFHLEHHEPCLDVFEREGTAFLRISSSNRGEVVYKLTGYSIGTDSYLAEIV